MDAKFGLGTLDNEGWKKGPWTAQEDKLLMEHVNLHGEGKWNSVSKLTGNRSPWLSYSSLVSILTTVYCVAFISYVLLNLLFCCCCWFLHCRSEEEWEEL